MTEPINATIARLIRNANNTAASGDYAKAQDIARQAVEKAEDVIHPPSRSAAHYTLAVMLWSDETASAEEAREHAAQALEHARIHTDEYYLTMTLLARIDAGLGNLDSAQALNENLLEIYERKQRHHGIADVMRNFGDIALKRDDMPAAREAFEKSLAIYENTVRDPLNHGGLLLSLGSLAYREGNFEEATQRWQRAYEIGQEHGLYQVTIYAQRALEALTEDLEHE